MFTWIKQIRALLKIKSEVKKLMDETKPVEGQTKSGWKTTEFWLAVAGGIATVGSAAAPLVPATALPYVAGVSIVLPAVYMLARTVAKLTASPKDDEFLDKLAGKLAPLIKVDASAPKA